MHIAILMTNTDDSAFAQSWPKDGEKFSALIGRLRPDWQFSVFSVKDGHFPADLAAFDGFIITGSPASVHDDQPWVQQLMAQIRDIAARQTPMFGACFGHQVIAMALGGTVGPNPGGWVLGQTQTMMNGAPIRLYAAHREQVLALPPGAQVLGGNEDCPIGSFAVGEAILTTQYHPEMTPEFIGALVDELQGTLPEAVISKARESLDKRAETTRIAQAIVSFLEQSY
jgi:GMP synthase-like glutamine amidotransferase